MDNMEENTERNMDPAGDSHEHAPEALAQSKDNSSRPQEEVIPAEIIPGTKKRVSVADATLLPAQFMGTMGSTQTVPSASDIIESIFRFKWTILVVFVIVAAPAIAAIWTQIVPKYQAHAEVRVRPIIPYLVFRTEDNGQIPLYSSFVNTQVSIIRSLAVLQRVLDEQKVQDTQWYKKPAISIKQRLFGTTATPMERLKDNLSASPRPRTEIIDLTFTYSNAGEAQLLLNNVLDHYIQYIRETSDATADGLYSQLVDQYKTLGDYIRGQEQVIAKLRQDLGTATPEELISGQRVRLDELQARLSQVRQNINLLEWEKQQANAGDSNDATIATDSIQKQPKYYEDEEWRRLDTNVRTTRYKIDNSLLTPNHPDAPRMENELKFAEKQLQLRENQLDEEWHDRLGNPLGASITIAGDDGLPYEEGVKYSEYQLARLKHQEQLLDDQFNTQKKKFDELFAKAQSFEKENNELLHKRELFNSVRQRVDQKTMERNVPGSIEKLTPAIVPSQPFNDRRIVFTAMALIMALGSGGGLAYLRSCMNQAIYTPKDMPHPMQVPFLGYIPVTPTVKLLDNEADSATNESIRVVRTALLSRLNGYDSTTVLVTSATEGTGKSTFTLMLAESLARSGKKVLLIDADFRKMTLTKRFNLCDKSGFIQLLSRRPPIKYYIFKTDEIPGLSFMPAGKQGDNGKVIEETANGDFKPNIDKLRKKFNIILFDSPPILPVADAVILSSQVDGTIIVERELVSRRADLFSALARVGSAGGRLLGTVFIGSHSHGKYGYGYHYSRNSE
jgi:succinoglycan biosynthesis transport protein ExoP